MPLPDLQALRHRGRQPHYPKRNRFFLAANANLRLTSLKKALAKLPVHNAILDGEIVCLDKNGVSRFYQLLHGKAEPVFYAFDLSRLNGEDLRPEPLLERKNRLSADKPFFNRPNLAS